MECVIQSLDAADATIRVRHDMGLTRRHLGSQPEHHLPFREGKCTHLTPSGFNGWVPM